MLLSKHFVRMKMITSQHSRIYSRMTSVVDSFKNMGLEEQISILAFFDKFDFWTILYCMYK